MRIGITGHSNLAPDAVAPVTEALREAVSEVSGGRPVTGVTCLARGADQLFARAVLELGGAIEVVLPAADYRERKVKPENAAEFAELIDRAAEVTTMPFETSKQWYWLNDWRREQQQVGARFTYGDLAGRLRELMRTEGRLPRIPSARMNNFVTDFRADPGNAGVSRAEVLAAWQWLKSRPGPHTYAHYRRLTDGG